MNYNMNMMNNMNYQQQMMNQQQDINMNTNMSMNRSQMTDNMNDPTLQKKRNNPAYFNMREMLMFQQQQEVHQQLLDQNGIN